nr:MULTISPECIES: site-specific DNA-methyltransferase [unclassified Staphylococcus]
MKCVKNELQEILLNHEEYIVEGTVNKNLVSQLARNYDQNLLNLLQTKESVRNHFFAKTYGGLIFKLDVFLQFLNNKEFLPDSYTVYKQKIGLANEDDVELLSQNKEVVLNWPYKDCVLEGGQSREDVKRNEILFNSTLAPSEIDRLLEPKALINWKKFSIEGMENLLNLNLKDNLIIKGNNIIGIHTIKKIYSGLVNCIYIDPPFNTGNDSFNYNDTFSRSTWLTFMKNRIKAAKDLLSEDGNIFIHIDINQSHYLKVLCDEIFGEKNFVQEIIWSYGSASGGRASGTKPVNVHDYILHYAKNYSERKAFKVYTPYSEKYIKDWFKYDDGDGRIYRRRQRKDKEGNKYWQKQYLEDSKGVPLTTVWNDIKQIYANPQAYKKENKSTSEIELDFGNSGQKPEKLIQRILEMCTEKNDLVLDFFLGSGTTAATCLKMNRQFIGIEQMDSQISIEIERLKEVIDGKKSGISKEVNWSGGGSFVYCEIKNDAQNFVIKIERAETTEQLLELFTIAKKSSFISYRVDPKKLKLAEFKKLSFAEQKQLLREIIDNNNLYVNYSDIGDASYGVSEEDIVLNRQFYGDGD